MREWQSLLQTSHLCVVSGRMELLPSFLRARLSAAAAAISFSSPVSRCCFRALLHSVRSAARPSQDIVSTSTAFVSLMQTYCIAGEGGLWFFCPKPAHRRGCILECDHPPYGGHRYLYLNYTSLSIVIGLINKSISVVTVANVMCKIKTKTKSFQSLAVTWQRGDAVTS